MRQLIIDNPALLLLGGLFVLIVLGMTFDFVLRMRGKR